jgi:hypothetical protein
MVKPTNISKQLACFCNSRPVLYLGPNRFVSVSEFRIDSPQYIQVKNEITSSPVASTVPLALWEYKVRYTFVVQQVLYVKTLIYTRTLKII